MNEYLILVDENDKPCGKMEKQIVHELGILHRAFSIFIFNSKGELLLQQRADEKYHSAGLWTNTCCSHPRYGEDISWAVERRLMQEMGMNCKTDFEFSFVYKAQFENGLTEYEFDHVYFGVTDDLPIPEKSEVKNWKYMSIENIEMDIIIHPKNYTEWLKICLPRVKKIQYK
ncbi:MAG: isopentenyl-diphosphate Delta-isomerase [Bacteroidetes bacterium]|nr:isopentenyl-diphosphate Delta-isomerase [Bacteroidota bacterium]